MAQVTIMIEGQDGLNWARWKRLAEAAEELGYAGLFRSDHFTNASGPLKDALEIWSSFTYLATNTKRIKFGALVSPIGFRHPVIAAWSASAINDLAEGRFHLGLGAGWQEREHGNYGFDLLGTLTERFDRLDEALQVVTRLFTSDEPFAFSGAYFNLHEALLLPRPQYVPRIVIGGNGPKRTMPLVATYADEWNGVGISPEDFIARSTQLDELLAKAGRQPGDVSRTVMKRAVVGKTEADALAKLVGSDVEGMRARGVLIGDPDQVAAGINAHFEAGADRFDMQWLELDDIDGLELVATRVFPQLAK